MDEYEDKLTFFVGGLFFGSLLTILPTMMVSIVYGDISMNLYTAILYTAPLLLGGHMLKIALQD
ncbi:MAG: hypothetical protein ACRCY4_09515 [Brevinema sp.]